MRYVRGLLKLVVVLSMLFGLCALPTKGADRPSVVKSVPLVVDHQTPTDEPQETLSGGFGSHSPQKIDPPQFELPKPGIVAGGFALGLFVRVMLGILAFVIHVALIVLIIVVVVRLLRRGSNCTRDEEHPLLFAVTQAKKKLAARRREIQGELTTLEGTNDKTP